MQYFTFKCLFYWLEQTWKTALKNNQRLLYYWPYLLRLDWVSLISKCTFVIYYNKLRKLRDTWPPWIPGTPPSGRRGHWRRRGSSSWGWWPSSTWTRWGPWRPGRTTALGSTTAAACWCHLAQLSPGPSEGYKGTLNVNSLTLLYMLTH